MRLTKKGEKYVKRLKEQEESKTDRCYTCREISKKSCDDCGFPLRKKEAQK